MWLVGWVGAPASFGLPAAPLSDDDLTACRWGALSAKLGRLQCADLDLVVGACLVGGCVPSGDQLVRNRDLNAGCSALVVELVVLGDFLRFVSECGSAFLEQGIAVDVGCLAGSEVGFDVVERPAGAGDNGLWIRMGLHLRPQSLGHLVVTEGKEGKSSRYPFPRKRVPARGHG